MIQPKRSPIYSCCFPSVQQALGLAWSNSGSLGGHKRIWPTLEPLSLRSGGVPAAVLAAGASQAVILTEHAHRLEHLFFPVC